MENMQTAALTLIGMFKKHFQHMELYTTRQRALYCFIWIGHFSRTNLTNFDFQLFHQLVWLSYKQFHYGKNLISTTNYFLFDFYCMHKIYEKIPFGISGNISSTVMEQFWKKQKILLAYDRHYIKICISNG